MSAVIQPASGRLIDAADKGEYVFVDTGRALDRLRASGKSIPLQGDGHLLPEGHRAIAEEVMRELKVRGLTK